ncbi:hypothetical protein PSPO01_11586 [Paraphaeosphaeria sporulosa]
MSVIPLFGLTVLFESASQFDEVREVAKFLGRFVYNLVRTEINVTDTKIVFFELVSMYTPQSSLAIALTLFGHSHLASFEAAVRSSLADVDYDEGLLSHDDPVFLQITAWLIRCACAPQVDPSGLLANKLRDFIQAQPQLSELPPPLFYVGGSGDLREEIDRAIVDLELEDIESCVCPIRNHALQILREFMRLAMNCGAVWDKYGPKEWDLASSPPQLSEEAKFAGYMSVIETWRRMIANPFSEAPLHIRHILARVNVVVAVGYFLEDLEKMSHSYSDVIPVTMDRMGDRFVQEVQWAAEDIDYETFHQFRETRLHNPFLGPCIPQSSFARPLGELEFTRQPLGESYEVSGIPTSDPLHLADLAGVELPANFRRYEYLTDLFYGPFPETIVRPHLARQPLLVEDASVYSGQLELATPPRLVAVGPLIRASDYSHPVNEADLREDDLCLICHNNFGKDVDPTNPAVRLHACNHLIHLEELEQLLNAAYFAQPQVRCGLCRTPICATRQTIEVVD